MGVVGVGISLWKERYFIGNWEFGLRLYFKSGFVRIEIVFDLIFFSILSFVLVVFVI